MQNATPKTPTVFIFSINIDAQSVRDFAITLNEWSQKNKGVPIRVDINSTGGIILEGLFLYEEFCRLRRNGHHLTLASYGRAASSAGWLLQAADWRVIGSESWLLIHEVSSKAEGTLTEMKSEVARCEEIQAQTFGILTASSGGKLTAEIIAKNVAEKVHWWLTPEESLSHGLVDEIEVTPTRQGKLQ